MENRDRKMFQILVEIQPCRYPKEKQREMDVLIDLILDKKKLGNWEMAHSILTG